MSSIFYVEDVDLVGCVFTHAKGEHGFQLPKKWPKYFFFFLKSTYLASMVCNVCICKVFLPKIFAKQSALEKYFISVQVTKYLHKLAKKTAIFEALYLCDGTTRHSHLGIIRLLELLSSIFRLLL